MAAALCVLGVLFVAGAYIVHTEQLHFDPVLSGSMRPKIEPGDLAVLSPVPVNTLRVGEVIAYLPPNHVTPVMHRIIDLNSQGVITKGDDNSVADPWGRVALRGATVEHLAGVIPDAGWLTNIRSQLMLGIGAVLILIVALTILTPGEAKRESPGEPADGAPLAQIVDLRGSGPRATSRAQ